MFKKGKNNINYIHGKTDTRLYTTYNNMIRRCYSHKSKSFANYGRKGITVCIAWRKNFSAFYSWAMANGYKDTLTIERLNNSKGYSPSNCTWILKEKQSYNKSCQKRNITGYAGITMHRTSFRARVQYKQKNVFNKTLPTLEQAVIARNNFIIKNNLPHKIQIYKAKI